MTYAAISLDTATAPIAVREFVHDGRHLFGFPCH